MQGKQGKYHSLDLNDTQLAPSMWGAVKYQVGVDFVEEEVHPLYQVPNNPSLLAPHVPGKGTRTANHLHLGH